MVICYREIAPAATQRRAIITTPCTQLRPADDNCEIAPAATLRRFIHAPLPRHHCFRPPHAYPSLSFILSISLASIFPLLLLSIISSPLLFIPSSPPLSLFFTSSSLRFLHGRAVQKRAERRGKTSVSLHLVGALLQELVVGESDVLHSGLEQLAALVDSAHNFVEGGVDAQRDPRLAVCRGADKVAQLLPVRLP